MIRSFKRLARLGRAGDNTHGMHDRVKFVTELSQAHRLFVSHLAAPFLSQLLYVVPSASRAMMSGPTMS